MGWGGGREGKWGRERRGWEMEGEGVEERERQPLMIDEDKRKAE